MPLSMKKTAEKVVASKEFSEGSDEDRVRILIELMFVTFDATRLSATRTYGKHKWMNSVHIKNVLNHIEPPQLNFDIR